MTLYTQLIGIPMSQESTPPNQEILPDTAMPIGQVALTGPQLEGYRAADAQMQELHNQWKLLSNSVTEGLDPADVTELDNMCHIYYESHPHESRRMPDDDSPHLTDFLAQSGRIAESVVDKLRLLERADVQYRELGEALAVHIPEKAIAVRGEVDKLESEINYVAIMAEYIRGNRGVLSYVGSLIGMQELLENDENSLRYSQLFRLGKIIDSRRITLAARGMLTSAPDRAETLEQYDPGDDLPAIPDTAESLGEFRKRISIVHELGTSYSSLVGYHEAMNHLIINQISDYILPVGPATYDEIVMGRASTRNEVLDGILRLTVQKAIRDLPARTYNLDSNSAIYQKFVTEAQAIDVTEALDAMEVVGDLDSLPLGYTVETLKNFIRTVIPPLAIAQTKELKFGQIERDDLEEGIVSTGVNKMVVEGDNRITVDCTLIARILGIAWDSSGYDGSLLDQARFRQNIDRTLVHEYGHTLHRALPFASLKVWNEAIADDEIDLNWYVEGSRKKSYYKGQAEDFATSMSMFVVDPEVLYVLSRPRFAAMRDIYKTFMPDHTKLATSQLAKIKAVIDLIRSGEKTIEGLQEKWHGEDYDSGGH